ncbi:hypothetical protein CORI_1379 [Campylobacter sp. CCUG 57310]|nr:hypothetical protein CORI_1379 [Campylobacter sp. CCUG 57310]
MIKKIIYINLSPAIPHLHNLFYSIFCSESSFELKDDEKADRTIDIIDATKLA